MKTSPPVKTKIKPPNERKVIAAIVARSKDGNFVTGLRKRKESLWKGPLEDGLTQSLLNRWLCCRERFRLFAVEGITEKEPFDHKLEFGNLWHEGEEAYTANSKTSINPLTLALRAIDNYRQKLLADYPADEKEINRYTNLCLGMFPIYLDFWRKHPDNRHRKYFLSEQSFRVSYKLPSGRGITLRGKIDAGFQEKGKTFIQENKGKGYIDEEGLLRTVAQNLQTMIYVTAFNLIGEKIAACPTPTKPLTASGILYNVIRRPLADKYALRPRKSESETAFIKRILEGIKANPANTFYRWKVLLDYKELIRFRKRILDNILENFLDWWYSIEANPFDPWNTYKPDGFTMEGNHGLLKKIPNPLHYQTPWGIYNSLWGGFRGDYFDYLTIGRTHGLESVTSLYPELA